MVRLALVVTALLTACETAPAAAQTGDVRAEFEAIAARLEAGDALFVGGSREAELRRQLGGAPPGSTRQVELQVRLGRELLRLGDSAGGLQALREALRLEEAFWERAAPDAARREGRRKRILFELVIGAVRLGEQVNCVGHRTAASCILPIRAGGVHADPAGALAAMDYARQYLRLAPDDLKGLWFLNLAAMQAGRYPDQVAAESRIPPERFAGAAGASLFRDVAPGLGIHTVDNAGGSVADDFDGDGRFDLVTSSMDPRASLRLLRNDGDGGFVDRTAGSGLQDQLGGLNLMHADYDADGRLDLLVLRGGWLQNRGSIRNSLLRNEGGLRFADVTRAAGVAEPARPTQTAAWADYDNDGHLDLYVGNEGERQDGRMVLFAGNLFRNAGDGTFADVAPAAGATNDRYAKGTGWGDYDGDGDADLYVSNVGPNRLYRNDGGRFVDVAGALGVEEPAQRSFATWFFDYDNDGDLDLFVAAYEAGIEDIVADVLGRPTPASLWPRLYRNDGARFADVTAAAGLDHPSLPMGANFGDLDEDGFLDIYLGTGSPAFEDLMPNLMYRNRGDGTFEDVTYGAGFGHLQKGHGVSFADFDRDGDCDVALQAGGFYPGDRFANALFENPGHGRRFLSVQLVGTAANRSAVGARLHVRVDGDGGARHIYRWVGTGGSFGGSPLEQFVGLGEAKAVPVLEVDWPASGQRQRFADVPLDSRLRVVEGEAELEVLPRRAVPFRAHEDGVH